MAGFKVNQISQEIGFISTKRNESREFKWASTEVNRGFTNGYESDFVEECSSDSLMILPSSEMVNHATSSSSSSSSSVSSHDGPLYELLDLMEQLPIKRGLSKYYEGKSESFGSFADLKSIQSLAKCGSQRSRKSTKSKFRSFGRVQSQTLSPKGIIVKNKKISSPSIARGSLFSSLGNMSSLLDIISVQNGL